MSTSEIITLGTGANPVRLSFPVLFVPKRFQNKPESKPRYEAAFLLDPSNKEQAATIALIKQTAKELLIEHFGSTDKIPKGMIPCYGNGNDKETVYDGYENMFYVTSANKTRPTVIDRQRNPLQEQDGVPYAGSYVVGKITLWVMDGLARINANLVAVQFVKDGEAFGVKPIDVEEEFETLDNSVESGPAMDPKSSAGKEDWE